MAIAEISVIPLGTGSPSLSEHIARVIRILEAEEVKYELTSMGTIIEGEVGQLLALAGRMHKAAFGEGVFRVLTMVKIDDRRDKPLSREGKKKAVEEKL